MDLKRSIQKFMSRKLFFYLASICFFSICVLVSTNARKSLCLDIIGTQLGKAAEHYSQARIQKKKEAIIESITTPHMVISFKDLIRRPGINDTLRPPYDSDTEFQSTIAMKEGKGKWRLSLISSTRRYLRGIGSSPPRCTSKCGKCTPCKPVHVPVPPGTPVTTEYYPEAWRCKCKNKLYMP